MYHTPVTSTTETLLNIKFKVGPNLEALEFAGISVPKPLG
jgi:hypothetical protein